MKNNNGYKSQSLTFNRRAVIASASVTKEKNAIHSFTEIDITEPRRLIKDHFEETGEKISLTSYIVTCLSQIIKENPIFNSFIKGNKQIILDDVTISILIETEIKGEKVPQPIGINKSQLKGILDIQKEIKEAQKKQSDKLGAISGKSWFNLIPHFLLKTFIRLASTNITMAKQYGVVAVTAVGMFCKEPVWFVPHGSSTVLLTIGSISKKVIEIDGKFESREHLCLTVSFDHNIIDGAPAARFMNQLLVSIKSGNKIKSSV